MLHNTELSVCFGSVMFCGRANMHVMYISMVKLDHRINILVKDTAVYHNKIAMSLILFLTGILWKPRLNDNAALQGSIRES